jgi:cyclopropane-fatty-acyl-phospholipid synthase
MRPTDRAARILCRVFAELGAPLAFRLWDGTRVDVGAAGASPAAIVFRSRGVFRRILVRPTPLRFGEAFIAGDIDIDGDIFGAMRAADAVEHLRIPLRTRLAVLASLALV